MAHAVLTLVDVTFAYDSSCAPILDGVSLEVPAGWTGVLGANGAGKTTLLRLAAGELGPLAGVVRGPDVVVLCSQRTDDPPPRLDAFLGDETATGYRLRGRLGVEPDWGGRWSTLSHGERKRAQIGTALWRRPAVLAVDEPTNHLDRTSSRALAAALRSFRGVGLIVSHDRALLDDLCTRCLLLDPPHAIIRPGGCTKVSEQVEAERDAARTARDRARAEVRRLERETASRGRAAAAADKQRSKRGISSRDHDAKSRIDAARVSGKDGQAGRLKRQLEGRVQRAGAELDAIDVTKKRRHDLALPGARSRRNRLLVLPAGSIPLGPDRTLVHGELTVSGDDRIAIAGPNGAGKSTLVRHLLARLEAGDVPADRVVVMPQEIDADRARKIVGEARRLPPAQLGTVMTTVACLGSRPEALLETELPSPGELRKLLLALGAAREPHLIVMDEPTNHLDLPSIECLEAALVEFPAALILVSHDERFLSRLARTVWELQPDAGDPGISRCTRSDPRSPAQ